MGLPQRYAVTLPGTPGGHAPPEVVVVHATGETTADGVPVYADADSVFLVEIQDDVARPLDAVSGPGRHTCLHATPLP
ncbi:DUF6296 family protein [Kitasatospora sp. NPDC001660]